MAIAIPASRATLAIVSVSELARTIAAAMSVSGPPSTCSAWLASLALCVNRAVTSAIVAPVSIIFCVSSDQRAVVSVIPSWPSANSCCNARAASKTPISAPMDAVSASASPPERFILVSRLPMPPENFAAIPIPPVIAVMSVNVSSLIPAIAFASVPAAPASFWPHSILRSSTLAFARSILAALSSTRSPNTSRLCSLASNTA